jgi:predicted unusual protein kinase regulating ubiquinone biosynthesis (AarF/ABC1/UbiB family)
MRRNFFEDLHRRKRKHRRSGRAAGIAAEAAGIPLSPELQARRLRLLLQELGPEHSCFALYLSSRIDALPAEFCRELAFTPDTGPIIAADEIHNILTGELGGFFDSLFAQFDFTPFQSTLVSQLHRALLRTGVPVIVVVLRPSYYALRGQADESQLIDIETLADFCTGFMPGDLLGDFIASLRRKTSFMVAREGMELMARDAASFELLRPHRCYAELSTDRLLTFELREDEPQEEQGLDRLMSKIPGSEVAARNLCYVWLQQALHGHCFPVDAQPQNVLVDKKNRISFMHCDLVGMPTGAQENLLSYFNSMLADDPDRAAMYLLREMLPAKTGNLDADTFRSSFRQAAYFGMLEPILGTDSNSLAQMVFQHWKTTLEHGYVPKPHLLCFYRGLFSIARIARKLAPEGDPLREGLEELRAGGAFSQLREIMDWRYWFQNSDKFASALVQLPHTFDDALTRASSPAGKQPEQRTVLRREAGHGSGTLLVVLSIAMLVISQLLQTHAWGDKIIPAALMLAGFLVLRGMNT